MDDKDASLDTLHGLVGAHQKQRPAITYPQLEIA